MLTPFLYFTAKPKRLEMVLPVIKHIMLHRLRKEGGRGETASRNDVHFLCKFFMVLMPRWETDLLLWDLLCSPGRITWEGDNTQWSDIATTRQVTHDT